MSAHEYSHERGEALRFTFTFDVEDVRLEDTPQGVHVEVGDCGVVAEPGGPALPVRVVRIAVPPGTWPGEPRVREGERLALTDEPIVVLAAQPTRPGASGKPDHGSEHRHADETCCCVGRGCCEPEDQGGPGEDRGYVVTPFASPEPAAPDPKLYEASARDRDVAVVRRLDQVGPTPVLALELRPVKYDESGRLELVTRIDVEVPYRERSREGGPSADAAAQLKEAGLDLDPASLRPMPEIGFTSEAQLRRHSSLLKELVLNHDVLVDLDAHLRPIVDMLPADYLVITDDVGWDAATIRPTGPLGGNLVAEFQRLAQHKRSRGVSAKVVTVTDIVGGRYGDFRTGARDLQEVIRTFLQDVHERWGVAWVLLGGDVDMIPMRWVAGSREGTMDVGTADPPGDNASFWTGTFLKMNVTGPGTWWPGDTMALLVNEATGALIPYDPTGASAGSGTGWYFTTNDTYGTRQATSSRYVRVNGPASVVNGTLRWLYEWNQVPTDLYYSSLRGWVIAYQTIDLGLLRFELPYVFDPAHDWDVLDNGVYGQFPGDNNLDGVTWATDVSVGRAPVASQGDARAFVDKVIAYETYGQRLRRFGADNSDDWVRRVMIAADNWGGSPMFTPTSTNPPEDERFRAASDVTVIHVKDVPAAFGQLIAHISDSDRRELPYNQTSTPASRGWHFATSASNHVANGVDLSMFGINLFIPLPSHWIVVHGPADERNPNHYVLDDPQPDGSMVDQEQLRQQLAADLPQWNRVRRLYADLTDLSPAQQAAAPVAYLTSTRLESELNASPHIVSLSGHGNPQGCCGGSPWMAAGLTNGDPGFIAYADSCLTAAHDWPGDSMGEALVKATHGAVAYVGSTRFSWIGQGDDVQRWFFHALRTTRHLGLLNDTRLALISGPYYPGDARWSSMALTLYGDPEMRVWRQPASRVWPIVKAPIKGIDVIEVELPKPPIPDPPPYVVHLAQPDGLQRTLRAQAGSIVRLDTSEAESGDLFLTVSIDGDVDHVPYQQTLTVDRAGWLAGRVLAVSHHEHGRPWTSVTVANGDPATGRRTVLVMDERPDRDVIVEAVVAAQLAGREINLYVDGSGDDARVERFRLEDVR